MKLSLLASGNKLINNIAALNAGVCRYVGRRFDPATRAFVPMDQPEVLEVSHSDLSDYVSHVKRGDLLPGDQSTAQLCGVAWVNSKPQ